MSEHLRNIALIGATGNIGSRVLSALLRQDKHSITVVSRAASKASLPSAVKVFRGDLQDPAFLDSALAGQDMLISLVGHDALQYEPGFLEAAVRAGVKVFLPSDFGNPLGDERFVSLLPSMKQKAQMLERTRETGIVLVNVVTSFWMDLMLENDLLEHKVAKRQTMLYKDALPANTTTTAQVALAMARVAALPYSTIRQHFEKCPDVYISSFTISQPDVFREVLKATGTKEEDWTISRSTAEELLRKGKDKIEKDPGDLVAMVDVSIGLTYKYGGPGPTGVHNELLGLQQEDPTDVIKRAVQIAQAK